MPRTSFFGDSQVNPDSRRNGKPYRLRPSVCAHLERYALEDEMSPAEWLENLVMTAHRNIQMIERIPDADEPPPIDLPLNVDERRAAICSNEKKLKTSWLNVDQRFLVAAAMYDYRLDEIAVIEALQEAKRLPKLSTPESKGFGNVRVHKSKRR